MDAWTRISRASVAAPQWVLGGTALLVLLLAPGLARLTIRTDGLALVPRAGIRPARAARAPTWRTIVEILPPAFAR